MMRWLKDKKKEKRSNSTGHSDGGKEDDYGFGKDKSATKSPSSRRELPPTPATPEEKSPHIYEEIPDLPLSCMSACDRAFLQSKFKKNKGGCTSVGALTSESACITSNPGLGEKDGNPYMVVSVDNGVRQTPTDFHRNGTPEVHCDVIVKDTHCEILLTRKPKVGAFRINNTTLSDKNENNGDTRSIRNNTHFCSRDRRASAYVHSAGNISSAFNVTPSAFSTSASTKIHSGGTSSSLAFVNVDEPLKSYNEIHNDGTSENGVTTYSAASNFIPRSTKLVFNPLPGKNPCKEAFGSDSSGELPGVGYPFIKNSEFGAAGGNFASAGEHQTGSKSLTYASIKPEDIVEQNIDNVIYATVQDQHFTDTNNKPKYIFDEIIQSKQHPPALSSLNDNNAVGTSPRTGIIRPSSPSNSSSCIYALVTFPTEAKHYNTIANISTAGYQDNNPGNEDGSNTGSLGVIYSSLNESFNNEICSQPNNNEISDTRKCDEVVFPSKMSLNLSNTKQENKVSCLDFSDRVFSDFNVDRIIFDRKGINYRGHSDLKDGQNNNCCTQQVNRTTENSEFPTSSSDCGHSFELGFCLCSDEHSSSCDCPDTKHSQDDDVASVAGAANDSPNSCRSCGRLIRQITYSESYSDETYEHVYSSRLLIRSRRRFSSPDITFSEALNSEFHDIQNCRSPEFPYPCSRDDSWASIRGSDIIPPSYSAAANKKQLTKSDHDSQIKEQYSDDIFRSNNIKTELRGHLHSQLSNFKHKDEIISNVSNVSTIHSLSCSAGKNSIVLTSNHSNSSLGMESCAIKMEDNSVMDNLWVEKSLVNVNQNKSFVEKSTDQSRKRDVSVAVESKGSAFTGLLSKFSRTKFLKSAKPEPMEISFCTTVSERQRDNEIQKCDKELEEIPEKNTKKLSKFFQRLSNKELSKSSDSVTLPEINDIARTLMYADVKLSGKMASFRTSLENYTISANCHEHLREEEKSLATLDTMKESKVEDLNCKKYTENSENTDADQIFAAKYQNRQPTSANASATGSAHLSPDINIVESNVPSSSAGDSSVAKLQNKTDSGDTCYEYDISTSSEGEQTSQESFLYRVKKTLNLEHEVQQTAESTTLMKKRQCKHCRKEGIYATIDEKEEGAARHDGFCPHFAANLEDLRAIFEDLVVDQRAAILDSLSDYKISPYNVRARGPDSMCRECGYEILTPDAESLTTVCSFLSQQFRMASPNGQTLSCDSDEGTMADNSCESADDECAENGSTKNSNNKNNYDDNSSGYDEPKGNLESFCHKQRKKEKKEKRANASISTNAGSIEAERLTINTHEGMSTSSISCVVPTETMDNVHRLQDAQEPTNTIVFSESHRKNVCRKNTSTLSTTHSSRQAAGLYCSHETDMKDNSEHSRICDISRLRASFITDKVLQDIYAPLPSKALSLLTTRNNGSPAGLSCTCGKGQASLATVTAHLATGKTITPPTRCIKKDNFLQPSSASLAHCDSDKMDGVVPVQKHSEREGKNSGEGELFNLSERKDNDGPKRDQYTMGVHHEKEILANNSCSLVRKNAESNNDLVSQIKPDNRPTTKKRSPVHAIDWSLLKNRSAVKQYYEPVFQGDFGIAVTGSHQGKEKAAQMSLPHTTKESAIPPLTSEIQTDNSSEHQHPENQYEDIYESSKANNSKIEFTRKHRLEIVALDILPESAVDDDTTEETRTHAKLVTHPRRSKVIENMAKMFEKTDNKTAINCKKIKNTDNSKETKSTDKGRETKNTDLVAEKNRSRTGNKSGLLKKYSSDVESQIQISQSYAQNSLNTGTKVSEIATNCRMADVSHSKRGLSCTVRHSQSREDHLCGRPNNHNLNFSENPCVSENSVTLTKPLRYRFESKQTKGNDKFDTESGIFKKQEIKSVKGKTKSFLFLTESRLVKQRSPTQSSSSLSSSSSSKKRNHTKHKMSKKSYNRKRSKHRSERSKTSHGKEERTYYYFSSDFSDIDVVEVQNCEPYFTNTPTHTSHINKFTHSKKRCSPSNNMIASSYENASSTHTQLPNSNIECIEESCYEKEIYSMPPSSSDLRSKNNSNDGCTSPQPSPEMTTFRKMKRTDLYKSKKCNNKLLSDLIIRNNDMQVYGNV